MRAVIGLGNPGKKYESTRHNIGFLILDAFAEKQRLFFKSSKRDYIYSEGTLRSSDFFLIKPTTYMNLSGLAVQDFLNDHPTVMNDLLVITDDVNLELGKIRLRQSGGDGGHNGLKSIIYHLQNDNFPRLRFGVGNKFDEGELAEYVLDRFSENELDSIREGFDLSVDLVYHFIAGGYKSMMDQFSRFNKMKKSDQQESDKIEGQN